MAKRQNFVVGSTNPVTVSKTQAELNNGWNKYQVLKAGDLDGVFNAVSDYSNDSSNEIANAIQALTGAQPTGDTQNELAGALQQMREDIETSSLTFKGYVATSAPSSSTYGLTEGNIWINASAMPTTFPVTIAGVWNGTSWESTTDTYTVQDFDFFRNINDNEGYYWFGGQWTVMSTDMSTTYFTLNQTSGKWEIKSSVNLPGSPTTTTPTSGSPDNQIATKKYVDESIAPLPKTTYFPDLFDVKWADHEVDDAQWLRADTFSWQSGAAYQAAYQHLVNDLGGKETYYFWVNSGHEERHCYTKSRTPSVGDTIYYDLTDLTQTGTVTAYNSGDDSVSFSYNGNNWTAVYDSTIADATETIAGITVAYFLADDGHKICPASEESNVTAIYNATGVAWYYIIDTTNQRFKLPRTKFGFTGIRSGVGGFVSAGLPNITAKVQFTGDTNAVAGGGAAYATDDSRSHDQGAGGAIYSPSSVLIDASEQNAIYGNSDTVQPPATEMYLYFYVGNFTQTALENTAGLNTELFNEKADLNLANVLANIDFVVERQEPTAANNYTWYRKYRSGWVEQGQRTTTVAGNTQTVNLPVEMSDTNYDLQITPHYMNAGSAATVNVVTITTTSFTVWGNQSGAAGYQAVPFSYTVCGMAAS